MSLGRNRTAEEEFQLDPGRTSLRGFYIVSVASVLAGSVMVALLNLATPINFFKSVLGHWMGASGADAANGLFLLSLVLIFLSGVPVLVLYAVSRPVAGCIRLIKAGREIPGELLEKGRRRLINLPFHLALALIVLWGIAPDVAAWTVNLMGYFDLKTGFSISGRASLVALVSASLCFFIMELYSRKRLIPLFFPSGRLFLLEKTVKFSIARRIYLSYTIGTLIPLLVLVITLELLRWDLDTAAVNAKDFANDFRIFVLVLVGIFIPGAFILNRLVARTIKEPLDDMLKLVDRVRHGDYRARVKVVTNDELGILGDASNAMIGGLAERQKLREEFGRYISPQIRDEILSGRIPLNGEHREATLLFSDLRNFTSFVDANRPDLVISGMRAYFTAMHHAIRGCDGLVLQFVGDEIEAVFGVPVPFPDHPDKAVEAALRMRRNLERLNAERSRKGLPVFSHGVGIHTGTVLAGNSGSEDQLTYSLIGSTVNVASRIQDLTKEFQCDILVSKETVDRLRGSFSFKEMPPRKVKGYSKEVRVFSLIG